MNRKYAAIAQEEARKVTDKIILPIPITDPMVVTAIRSYIHLSAERVAERIWNERDD
jgi:hypothetical protein